MTRWIVLSLDAFATASIGCYGSSWNATPCLDRLAAYGTVWDRAIVSSDDSVDVLTQLWSQLSEFADLKKSQRGRFELFLPAGELASQLAEDAGPSSFDECNLIECIADEDRLQMAPTELEDTAIAKLLAPVIQRLQEGADGADPWSLIWVHSDLLTRVWDAPRALFAVNNDDDAWVEGEAGWNDEIDEALMSDSSDAEMQAVPPSVFPSNEVPALAITPEDHPDLVTSWMNTYGCQVRLIDSMLSLIVDAVSSQASDIGILVVGTSGVSLGQNGWIGHRIGPIRSPQIHVPAIAFQGKTYGIRIAHPSRLEEVLNTIPATYSQRCDVRPNPEEWATEAEESHVISTRSSRATRVLTTKEWFYVCEEDRRSLYLKPDDREDVNDIADRCRTVVDTLDSHE